jgi:hypothetical protein
MRTVPGLICVISGVLGECPTRHDAGQHEFRFARRPTLRRDHFDMIVFAMAIAGLSSRPHAADMNACSGQDRTAVDDRLEAADRVLERDTFPAIQ